MEKKQNAKYNEIVNRFLDQGVDEAVAHIKAMLVMDSALEIQKPDVYTPMVFDDKEWVQLKAMLSLSKDIQLAALRFMRRSKKRSFNPTEVLVAVRRNNKDIRHVRKDWAINAVQYAKCNHELNLRGEITRAEATRRATSCVWYDGCAGLEVDFKNSVINVMHPIGEGSLSIPVKNLKRRNALRNIKLEKDGITDEGLQLTYHHHDDVKHESEFMQKLMKDALAETKGREPHVSEHRDLLEIIITFEDVEAVK